VDGAQLHLRLSKSALPQLPGELPVLEVQMRNQGTGTVTFVAEAILRPHIEIDGVWYAEIWVGSCCSAPQQIDPNQRSVVFPIRIVQANAFELNTKPARQLKVWPGRHSVRVRARQAIVSTTSMAPGIPG
jgi:hypothetical protein